MPTLHPPPISSYSPLLPAADPSHLLPLLLRKRQRLRSMHEAELHARETLGDTYMLLVDHGLLLGRWRRGRRDVFVGCG